MTATTVLRSEHDCILAMVACLRAACKEAEINGQFDAETFHLGVDFIRQYADAWHHAKEENLLFPALEAAGMPRQAGPVAVMLHEHVLGRSYAGKIAENLEEAAESAEAQLLVVRYTLAWADLLTQHIQKENGILFNMADQMLDPEEQQRLEMEYQAAIPAGADAETGNRFEQLVEDLCQRWAVDPRAAASLGDDFRCG